MIDRFRLQVPDSVTHSCYFRSCRAWLVLSTCLGLQAIMVLMIGVGPLAEVPYEPATLTNAGRFFLAAEYDTQAYATGCVLTVLLACLGLWVWNRCLSRIGRARAEAVSRRGASVMLGVAVMNVVAFAGVVIRVAPGLTDSRRVSPDVLFALSAPGAVVIVAMIVVLWRVLRESEASS